MVDFEIFRADLMLALAYSDGAQGGRPPFDPTPAARRRFLQDDCR